MEKLGTTCENGHAKYHDGCMSCLELAMRHDEAQRAPREDLKHVAFYGLWAETIGRVIDVLSRHAGEDGRSEGAVEVAERLSKFWRSAHCQPDPVRVAALPPPVCTGSGHPPTDWNSYFSTGTSATCGICHRQVGVIYRESTVVTVVHPYERG